MYIILEKTLPNGAIGSKHYIDTITIRYSTVTVNVLSKTLTDAICWSEPVTVPYDIFTDEPNGDVAAFLTAPGGYLEGGTITVEPSEIEVLKLRLNSQVERIRDSHISGGALTEFGVVDTDVVSIRNISGAYSAALASLVASMPYNIKWRLADNSLVDLDAVKMISLGNSVLQHVDFCYNRSWQLKDLIKSEDITLEELQALDLEIGWSPASDEVQREG